MNTYGRRGWCGVRQRQWKARTTEGRAKGEVAAMEVAKGMVAAVEVVVLQAVGAAA